MKKAKKPALNLSRAEIGLLFNAIEIWQCDYEGHLTNGDPYYKRLIARMEKLDGKLIKHLSKLQNIPKKVVRSS